MTRPFLQSMAVAAIFFAVGGCDSLNEKLNDSVPEIGIDGGVFGLNGETGAVMNGTFTATGSKVSGINAVAGFLLTRPFDDANAGDFSEITNLTTTIRIAIETGNVAMRLTRGSNPLLPASVVATNSSLDWSISDAEHQGVDAFGTPTGSPIVRNFGSLTFTREAGCAATAATCGYTVSGADMATLASLYPIETEDEAYLALLSEVVMQASGAENTPNSITIALQMNVTNPISELTGISATLRIAEYETTITPVVF